MNQAVKRNLDRFPNEFRFQLTNDETKHLKSQIVTSSSSHGGRRVLPYVFTRISATLKKDLEKHNQQYPAITLLEKHSSHDRFIIIDNTQLYHIGASLKDLGNKCFAFSRMDDVLPELATKLLNA